MRCQFILLALPLLAQNVQVISPPAANQLPHTTGACSIRLLELSPLPETSMPRMKKALMQISGRRGASAETSARLRDWESGATSPQNTAAPD